MSFKVLVVDDEESIRYTFQAFLEDAGYQVDVVGCQEEALERIEADAYDVVFLDILLGRDSGMEVLRRSRERHPNCPVVMVTGAPDIATASEAVRLGAFDYITKPVHQEDLLRKADLAVRHKALIDLQEMSRLRMEAVFRSINEGILIFDDNVRLIEMNQAASDMFGSQSELVGKTLPELVANSGCDGFRAFGELIENRCEGEIYSFETTDCRGAKLVISLSIAPLTSVLGEEVGVVLVVRDESRRN